MNKRTQRRCALVATILVMASFLLTGCASASLRPHMEPGFSYITDGYVDDTAALDGTAFAATPEQTEILSGMQEMLSTDKAALYMGESYDIALQDKHTGAVWFSNRAQYEDPFAASDADLSQLALQFYDSSDTLATMYSHPDAYDGEGLDQVTVETLEDAVQITYAFGTRLEDLVIAPAFSVETYNKLVETSKALIDAGELTVMQAGRFKMGYIQLVYNDLSPADRDAYTKQYPKFPELGEMYAMKPNLTNLQKREIEEISQKLGLTAQAIEEEVAKLGELADNQEQSPYFEVTLEYRLDGRDLLVTMDPQKIVEQDTYKLTRVELLGGLGAVSANEGNYLFVPDGSGVVINAVQDTELLRQVTLPFYGSDAGVNIRNQKELASDCAFPVFGLYEGARALVVVAESGEALAGLTASLPDDISVYARITPYYTYRMLDAIDLNGMGETAQKNVYSDEISAYPLVLRYHPLYGDSAEYSGMARYYRRYLIQRGWLPEETAAKTTLDIDLLGAFSKKEMRYGIQIDASKSATTFEQAQQIVEQLKAKGVTALDVQYMGMLNGGLDFSLASTAKVEKVLGGAEGFASLRSALAVQQTDLFPAVDLTRVYRKGNGLNQTAQLSRYLSKEYATIPTFLPADGERSKERVGYLVSAVAFGGVAERFMDSYKALEHSELYLASIGSWLSGDYHEDDEVDREESKLLTAQVLKALSDGGYRLKLDGGNAYTLPFVSALTNVAVDSRDYTLYTASVPFVGMVLHGHLPYTGPAVNRQGNQQEALLKTLESGAGLHYMLMSENPIVFADTAYSEYFSLSADQWIGAISAAWSKASAVYAQLDGATLDAHETVAKGVVACRYSNGACLLINYNDAEVTVEGQTLPAQDFALKGGDTYGTNG